MEFRHNLNSQDFSCFWLLSIGVGHHADLFATRSYSVAQDGFEPAISVLILPNAGIGIGMFYHHTWL